MLPSQGETDTVVSVLLDRDQPVIKADLVWM